MDSSIVLQNPDAVRDEMRLMDSSTRARGEKYFAEGRVENLRPGKEEGEFLAEVRGSALYEVRVVFDEDGIDEESCSCPKEDDCKHIYATLKALLVGHTQGHVHALSSMQRSKPGEKRPKEEAHEGTFEDQ